MANLDLHDDKDILKVISEMIHHEILNQNLIKICFSYDYFLNFSKNTFMNISD